MTDNHKKGQITIIFCRGPPAGPLFVIICLVESKILCASVRHWLLQTTDIPLMQTFRAFCLLSALGLGGCAIAPHQASNTLPVSDLRQMSVHCNDGIYQKAGGVPGTTILESYAFSPSSAFVFAGGRSPLAFESSTTVSLPMRTATQLDGGQPGAAWKSCMSHRLRDWRAAHR